MQILRNNQRLTPLDHGPQIPIFCTSFRGDGLWNEAFTDLGGAPPLSVPSWGHGMEKAIRRAICSASDTDSPSITSFALPSYPNNQSAYYKHLSHPLGHLVIKIPKANFRYENSTLAPKRGVIIFYVFNKEGHEEFVKEQFVKSKLAREVLSKHSPQSPSLGYHSAKKPSQAMK